MVEAFAADFMKANPDIEIKIESVPEADYFRNCCRRLPRALADTFQIPAGQYFLPPLRVLQPLDASVASVKQ